MSKQPSVLCITIENLPVRSSRYFQEELTMKDINKLVLKFTNWIHCNIDSTFQITSLDTHLHIGLNIELGGTNSNSQTIDIELELNGDVTRLQRIGKYSPSSQVIEAVSDVVSLIMKMFNGDIDPKRCKAISGLLNTSLSSYGFAQSTTTKL